VRVPGRRGGIAELAIVRDRGGALALAADREGLVLDDGLEPGDELVLGGGGRLGDQDLEGALVGVLGVLGSRRVAARGRQDLRAAALQQVERDALDIRP
jgi:hypothetical protein